MPFYGTQLWANLGGGEGSCKPNWTEPAQDELIAQFWADAPQLLPTLGSKPHWMQLSEIEWMIHRGCGEGWGIPLACHPLAAHVIFATPEALTKLHPTAYLAAALLRSRAGQQQQRRHPLPGPHPPRQHAEPRQTARG